MVDLAKTDIIDAARPQPLLTLLRGILANIPLGPVNPLGLLDSMYSVARDTKLKRDFDWLYLLHDLRKNVPRRISRP